MSQNNENVGHPWQHQQKCNSYALDSKRDLATVACGNKLIWFLNPVNPDYSHVCKVGSFFTGFWKITSIYILNNT